VLDTVRRLATPEGCVLDLRLAGAVSRARAWLLDAGIRLVLFIALAQSLAMLGGLGAGLILLSGFVIEWLYPILFEVYGRGATPGKRMCNLVVLHDDGTPVGLAASVTRNTLRFVDSLPLFYGVGFTAMLSSGEAKRLGDLVAGTVVVYDPAFETELRAVAGDAEPPRVALSVDAQRAVIEYAQRAERLTPERAEELALLATPLTAGMVGQRAQRRLLAVANYLLGKR
jgi:uncharacterized RDD family membrane protein YckC